MKRSTLNKGFTTVFSLAIVCLLISATTAKGQDLIETREWAFLMLVCVVSAWAIWTAQPKKKYH